MMANQTILDSEELLHLAIQAMEQGQAEKAIVYLKKIIEQEPDNSKAHYLLGAMHAEIGMYDRATQEMEKAIQIDPGLYTAHFQLGLLYATSGNIPEAEKAWQGLDVLGDSDPLFLFKRGMLNLVQDKFNECIEDLKQGIQINTVNIPLNNDMMRILQNAEQILAQQESSSPASNDDLSDEIKSSGKHALLSAYEQDEDEKKH